MFKARVKEDIELEYKLCTDKIKVYKRADEGNQKDVLQFIGEAQFTGDLKTSINSVIDSLYNDMDLTMKPIIIEIQAKDLNSGEIIRYTKINEKTFGLEIIDRGSYPVEINCVSSDYALISRGRII